MQKCIVLKRINKYVNHLEIDPPVPVFFTKLLSSKHADEIISIEARTCIIEICSGQFCPLPAYPKYDSIFFLPLLENLSWFYPPLWKSHFFLDFLQPAIRHPQVYFVPPRYIYFANVPVKMRENLDNLDIWQSYFYGPVSFLQTELCDC